VPLHRNEKKQHTFAEYSINDGDVTTSPLPHLSTPTSGLLIIQLLHHETLKGVTNNYEDPEKAEHVSQDQQLYIPQKDVVSMHFNM